MANITLGQNLLSDSLNGVNFFDSGIWLIGLILTMGILMLITRDMGQWAIWAFPISITLQIIGIEINIIQLMLTGVMFVVYIFSKASIGTALLPNSINRVIVDRQAFKGLVRKERLAAQRKQAKGVAKAQGIESEKKRMKRKEMKHDIKERIKSVSRLPVVKARERFNPPKPMSSYTPTSFGREPTLQERLDWQWQQQNEKKKKKK